MAIHNSVTQEINQKWLKVLEKGISKFSSLVLTHEILPGVKPKIHRGTKNSILSSVEIVRTKAYFIQCKTYETSKILDWSNFPSQDQRDQGASKTMIFIITSWDFLYTILFIYSIFI